MYLEQRIKLEEEQKEREFQSSLNLVQKLADNPWHFCLTLILISPIMLAIGIIIGTLL
jgi:membrane protein insertase Oxa1/YidC/SpoIIIJ